MNPSLTSNPRRARATLKKQEALKLRAEGLTFREIAERVGYADRKTASDAVRLALQQTLREPADEVRQLELARLDKLMASLWGAAMLGQWKAIDRVLAIMDRRAKYLGLHAPVVTEINWREEAARYGIDPSTEFDKLVQQYADTMAGENGGSSVAGSTEASGGEQDTATPSPTRPERSPSESEPF